MTADSKSLFTWEGEVRVNETDLQGIVNNANYFIYLAHARCKQLQQLGIDFNELHQQGFDLVVVRTEIDFKAPLKNGDEFIVTSSFVPQGRVRLVFLQQILRKNDGKPMVEATSITTCIATTSGRPVIPAVLKPFFTVPYGI